MHSFRSSCSAICIFYFAQFLFEDLPAHEQFRNSLHVSSIHKGILELDVHDGSELMNRLVREFTDLYKKHVIVQPASDEEGVLSEAPNIELRHFADLVLRIRAQCYNIEAANVRHEHEWQVWKDVKLPDGKILMPGVISHATDLVEHPDVVKERFLKYASVVGKENVAGGTDCGIGSRVGHEEIVWAKLGAMSEGARRASAELWGA